MAGVSIYEAALGVALHLLLFVYVIVNFLMATFVDPGRFPKQVESVEFVKKTTSASANKNGVGNGDTRKINDVLVRLKWCSTCQFYRPPRSSHCSACNACIDVREREQTWIGNKCQFTYLLVY